MTGSSGSNPSGEPAATPIHTELHNLPLWQTTLAAMRKEGVRYGKTYSNEYLELRLGANRSSAEFGFAIMLIRKELLHSGFYLTARGQAGNGYAIAEPESLGDIALHKERRGINELCEAVILLSNADVTSFTYAQRRRTEAILSRVAQRAALVSRKLPRELPGEDEAAAAA